MFSVGMTSVGNTFFAISTMLLGIPTGIKIFNCWGRCMAARSPGDRCSSVRIPVPVLIAGLTGVMLAVAPLDWQLTDSYFVVAHFHYMLVGSFLSQYSGGIYYCIQRRLEERKLSRRLGRWHFWLS